jgi:hypothetical protein
MVISAAVLMLSGGPAIILIFIAIPSVAPGVHAQLGAMLQTGEGMAAVFWPMFSMV